MAKEKTDKKETKETKAGPKSKAAVERAAKRGTKKAPVKVGEPKPLHGKKYRAAEKLVEAEKLYPLNEAVELVLKTATTKFDSAVELHVHVASEARGMLTLPKDTGKKTKVVVFDEAVAEELAKGKINFDILLAKPADMPNIAKFAKLLGPKGLMPNPKSGTVTEDVEQAKKELAGGKAEYRTDEGKNIHLVVGKAKSKAEDLLANINEALRVLTSHKILSITLATTMGPGVHVALPAE